MTPTSEHIPNLDERACRLIALLEQQRDCYGELKRLAQRQRQLITEQDPEALLKILAERQRLVDRLAELNKSLIPFRQEWANTYSQMLDDRRQYVQKVLDEINTLLGSILISDAEDSRLLATSKESVRAQMSTTAVGRMASHAYATHAYSSAGIPDTAGREA